LLNDPARIPQLGEAASTRAENFQPARMAQQYVTLYRQLHANFIDASSPFAMASADQTLSYAEEQT
jgi:hypothetical protein